LGGGKKELGELGKGSCTQRQGLESGLLRLLILLAQKKKMGGKR